MKSAVFIGHDDCYDLNKEDLKNVIINCIENGTTQFYCGGQGGFDRACAVLLSKFKTEYPQIKNILVILQSHQKYLQNSMKT